MPLLVMTWQYLYALNFCTSFPQMHRYFFSSLCVCVCIVHTLIRPNGMELRGINWNTWLLYFILFLPLWSLSLLELSPSLARLADTQYSHVSDRWVYYLLQTHTFQRTKYYRHLAIIYITPKVWKRHNATAHPLWLK